MPLEPPDLDVRTFDELLAVARARIPRYTPEWTDFNESDPGITLLELFAWLTEQMLVQMNRVPEHTYLKVLQMLGFEQRPARAAVAHLTFVPDPAAAEFRPIDAGTRIAGQPAGGGDAVVFETTDGFDLIHVPLNAVQLNDGGTFVDLSTADAIDGTSYRPFGWVPQVGNALYLGFSPPEPPPAGGPLALSATDPFPDELRFRVFLPSPGDASDSARTDVPQVTLIWEYAAAAKPTRWRALNTYWDETAAFTREGYIRIEGPARPVPTTEGSLRGDRFWIRCRFAGGAYPASGAPEIDFIRCNTVPAENLSTVRNEILGISNGRPGQTFTLASTPVERKSLRISVELENAPVETWTLVGDFYAADPDDEVAVLTPASGEIRFGDGEHGRIPAAGAQVIAQVYRYGGGPAGNLGADLIDAPQTRLASVAEVFNLRPATGGRIEQPISDLMASAPSRLRQRERAMSATDFAMLATEAGGVSRAKALPLTHPAHPDVEVPGAVTVIIVPEDGGRPPRPSHDLVDRVLERLEPARLITTELYVTSPDYRSVSVTAVVRADPSVAGGTVQRQVLDALESHLDPRARDFGADLIPTMLYGVIQRVPAVRDVPNLTIEVAGQPREITEQITAGPGTLFYGEDHQITIQPYVDR